MTTYSAIAIIIAGVLLFFIALTLRSTASRRCRKDPESLSIYRKGRMLQYASYSVIGFGGLAMLLQ
ncbi:MAG: hypothetical protein K1V87_06625 [Muribaculum sp.]